MVSKKYIPPPEYLMEEVPKVEMDAQGISDICGLMIDKLRPILITSKKNDSSFIEFEKGVGQIKKVLSTPKGHSKSNQALKEHFDQLGYTDDEMFVMKEFGEVLVSTYKYLSVIDPNKERFPERDPEYLSIKAENGAPLNISFGDFVLKTHKRFDLSDEDVFKIMNNIFEKHGLKYPFSGKSIEFFVAGFYSFTGAYLELKKHMTEEGNFEMPTKDQDINESFDLIWKSGSPDRPNRYFEIKSGPLGLGYAIVDIEDPEEFENAKADIQRISVMDLGGIYESARDLSEAIRKHKNDGENCKGYIMFVPVKALLPNTYIQN